jgi:hypothetical protein
MTIVQRIELTRLAQCILVDMLICIDARTGLFVSLDALQVHARQALRRQHVGSQCLPDFRNGRLDQLELRTVAAVPVVIVVVVGEDWQVEGKNSSGAERQE